MPRINSGHARKIKARARRPRGPVRNKNVLAPPVVAEEEQAFVEALPGESLETDVAPDLLDKEAPTAEDLN